MSNNIKLIGKKHEEKNVIVTQTIRGVVAATTVGSVKKTNEDCFMAKRLKDGTLVCAIADGHWGYFASQHAINKIMMWKFKENSKKELIKVLQSIEADIFEKFGTNDMDETRDFTPETSIIILLINNNNKLKMISYGDALAFISSGSAIRNLTNPKATWLGCFSKLGLRDRLPLLTGSEYVELELLENKNIILCTDGVTEPIYETPMVSKEQILNIVENTNDTKGAVVELIRNSLRSGGEDNVTCGIVDL